MLWAQQLCPFEMKLGLWEMKRRAKIIETLKAENKSQRQAASGVLTWSFLRAVVFTQGHVVAWGMLQRPGLLYLGKKGLCIWSLGIEVKDAAKLVRIDQNFSTQSINSAKNGKAHLVKINQQQFQ